MSLIFWYIMFSLFVAAGTVEALILNGKDVTLGKLIGVLIVSAIPIAGHFLCLCYITYAVMRRYEFTIFNKTLFKGKGRG